MPDQEKEKTIFIRNVYHMLSYAFRVLTRYDDLKTESFEDAADLLAAILAKGVAQQIKHGLYREYIEKHETLPVIRGKLDLRGTIRNRIRHDPKAVCEFDELSEDNLFNRIVKTTMKKLLRTDGVKPERKALLKKNLVFFDGVSEIPSVRIQWNRIRYRRNNRNYEMLIRLCEMILDGMVQTTEKGGYRLAAFEEKHMPRLYEDFILEYYKRHRPDLEPGRTIMEWDCRGIMDDESRKQLPVMKTDITLRKGGKTLIIDAKYYGHILKGARQNAQPKLPSANLYQIYAYVKNLDMDASGNVSGLLLYAKTNELNVPKCRYNLGGNGISAQTLNLNCNFNAIKDQLNRIAVEHFGSPPS